MQYFIEIFTPTKFHEILHHYLHSVYSQQQYIATGLALSATGLALCKNIRSPAIHRASPVYSQMRYIVTGLTHSTNGATLLSKLVQSN